MKKSLILFILVILTFSISACSDNKEITGRESYLDKALDGWSYTKKYFVDYTNGGWYSLVNEKGVQEGRDKANYWTCPYHNGRMCMEVIERIKE
jgi:cellobiose epimerase